VAGGLAGGALVGRADILEAFNPKTPKEKRIRHTGTWNANPLLCSAGIAACKLYLSGEPQRKAREAADYLRRKGNQVMKERNISGRLYSRSIVHIYFGPIDYEPPDDTMPPTNDSNKLVSPAMVPIRTRLCLHFLQRGVATQIGRYFALSAAHTKQDIDQTMDAFADSLDAMLHEGTLDEGGKNA